VLRGGGGVSLKNNQNDIYRNFTFTYKYEFTHNDT